MFVAQAHSSSASADVVMRRVYGALLVAIFVAQARCYKPHRHHRTATGMRPLSVSCCVDQVQHKWRLPARCTRTRSGCSGSVKRSAPNWVQA